MMIQKSRFNIYFVAALTAVLSCSCKSDGDKHKKDLGTLRIHIQVSKDGSNLNETVPVYRNQPFMVTVNKEPFLTEANVVQAKVFDALGGFEMSLKLDRQGSWLLDEFTGANLGKHLAVFSQWVPLDSDKLNAGRWLAAPEIKTHIKDGVIIFTPDTSREEAEQIARGLNNVAKKLKTGSGFDM